MNSTKWLEPSDPSQKARVVEEMTKWVQSLAPWYVYSTLTFRWQAGMDSTVKAYEGFMRRHIPGVSNFFAVEENPSRDGHHVHALWADCHNVVRKDLWREWFARFGRARITPIVERPHDVLVAHGASVDGPAGLHYEVQADRGMTVAAYCAKYVCKEGAWWNARMVGFRHPQNVNFQLVA